jgi:hypothetical protein
LARLVKDYQTYSKAKPNVTFVGINTSAGIPEKKMRAQIDEYALKPFANVADTVGSIAAAYAVPAKVPYTLVIVDADGNIACNIDQYLIMGGDKDNPYYKYQKLIDEGCKACKGILGDTKAPAGAESAAHLFNLQQFDQLDMELARLKGSDSQAFKDAIKAKITEYTAKRIKELQTLGEGNALAAYRETLAFAKAFPKCKELSTAQSLAQKLNGNPKVKKENEAESAFQQVLTPELNKTTTGAAYDKKVKPLLDAFIQRYGDTEFGASIKVSQEEVRKSLR